jgi:3-oxoacyl-[acyl-carrier protein] reductase
MPTPGEAGPGAQKLKDRVAVVTGGSSGIGAACVRALAAEGARMVIAYHRGEERAEALRASLPGSGHRCVSLSLTDSATHTQLARALESELGRLDILINSAGFTKRIAHKDLEQLDPALFNEILLANAGGTYSVIRALMPLLKASKDAVVVSISSISAFTGSGSSIAYCAAKAALDTMTMSLARAHGPVRFLCVSPASVDTDFIPGRDRAELEKKAAQTPLGRVVTPEDVALATLACITHLRTATGTRMVIDGGYQL